MNEKIFSIDFEGNTIWGILNEPQKPLDTKKVIVFAHGMAGYRIGPHQMFVEYARKLESKGYYCFRFDFLGNGFGELKNKEIYEKHRIRQFQTVVRTLKHNFGFEKVGLLGICSGAYLSFQLSLKIKVDYVMLLSMLPLQRETKELALDKSSHNFRSFSCKIIERDTWVKLFTNRLNFKILIPRYKKNIKMFLFAIFTQKKKADSLEKEEELKNSIPVEYTVESLLIYGENDPETNVSLTQLKHSLDLLEAKYNVVIIKGANHSFYSLHWKQEVFEVISNWLKRLED